MKTFNKNSSSDIVVRNDKNNLFRFLFPNSSKFHGEKATRKDSYRDFFSKYHSKNLKPIIALSATFLAFSVAVFLMFYLSAEFETLHNLRMNSTWGFGFIVVSLVLLSLKICFLLFILYNYLKYKPVKAVADELLPNCTIIVPAYNEGKLVWDTLRSLANSDFPAEKLQIIAIDDGSKDDTWEWMRKAKSELGKKLMILQQPKNMGKRHALYRAFKIGTGDIFVTVDSDSIVKKNTLKNLVSPFIMNKDCGAVAGNVKVLNNKKAIIPKMLNVSFVFSFEFIRSAQSNLGSVLCTPGALAAYKREAVLNCLPQWINQKFFGELTDIGEDRAMTNMILKQGYNVKFQKNAHVLTNIPEHYTNLRKMFTRWERSNVRENIMMSKFAFSNFRKGPKTGTRILLLNQWLKIVTAYPMTILMLVFIILNPILFTSSMLTSMLVFSSIPAYFYAKKHTIADSLWIYSYSVFYAFTLFWITPYAIATANKRGWLTRGLVQKN